MKVLLLQPPVQDFYHTDIRLQPIGLAYLKAAVRKHLPEVRIMIKDFHHGWGRRTIALPWELAYLKDYYSKDDKSPFSTFHHYYHFGADFDAIAEEVAKEKPDLVGIASLFAPYHREVLRCAEAIKARCRIPILLGGSQVSAMPEYMLSHPAVDLVIQGEGEKPFVELLKALQRDGDLRHVPNLGYKMVSPSSRHCEGDVARSNLGDCHVASKRLLAMTQPCDQDKCFVLNPRKENYPIETLPFPDLSDLPQNHYLFEKKPLCFIITSRGCPYRCAFCSVHKTFGRRCRRRSAENILTEIQERYAEGYRVFDFEDDNLSFDRKEMTELCRKLIRAFPEKDIQLLAMNGVCYWTLDRDILKLMRRAGFTHLNLSLVSANTDLLEKVRRPGPLKKYREIIRHATGLGFKTVAYQILGLPGDTLSSMIKTLLFNAKLPALLGASPFYLIPYSPIARSFDAPSEADIYKARLTAMAIETEDFKREDLYTLLVTTRILNFLKGFSFHAKEISLAKALAIAEKQDARSAAGAQILRKLLKEKVLCAATSKGLEPLPRFKSGLFFQLWQKLDIIRTLKNKALTIRS